MHDISSIDIKQKTITSYLDLSPAQCRLATEGSPITLLNHQITMKKGIIEQHLRWNGDADELKLELIQNKNKQCRSEYCEGLKSHTHSENQLPNKSLDRLLRPQLSDELKARENDFKRIDSSTY